MRSDPDPGRACAIPATHTPPLAGSGMASRHVSMSRGLRSCGDGVAGDRMKMPPRKLPDRKRARSPEDEERFESIRRKKRTPSRKSVETGKNGKKAERKRPAVVATEAGKQSRIVKARAGRFSVVRRDLGEIPCDGLLQGLHHALELFCIRPFQHDADGHFRS